MWERREGKEKCLSRVAGLLKTSSISSIDKETLEVQWWEKQYYCKGSVKEQVQTRKRVLLLRLPHKTHANNIARVKCPLRQGIVLQSMASTHAEILRLG